MAASERSYNVVVDEDWISELPRAIGEEVRGRMSVIELAAGEALTVAGRPATRMFQVIDGYIRVNGVHHNGSAALITIYIPGNCLAESPVIARRRHNHTSIALVDSRLGALSTRDFWDLYRQHPQIPEALCRKFSALISRQMDVREANATFSLGQRIALMFENLITHCAGPTRPDGVALAFPFTQWDIAALFDVSRQSVHREISQLKSLGVLEKRAGVWVIADRQRLRNLTTSPRHKSKRS